ncbi:MAG: MBL fold metallo-hydrolase [Bacteroidota bacterium]
MRDKRLRTSILFQSDTTAIAVDSGPDFRQQMLRANIQHLDAILMTHEHNDHIIGLDDVRPFNFMNRTDMPVYATARVSTALQERFAYIFAAQRYPGAPMVKLEEIHAQQSLQIGDFTIQPIEVLHGRLPVLGYRVGDFAYITDMKTISDAEFEKLQGVATLVVNALHHSMHHSHLNLEEALAFVERLQPKQAYLTHISHRMGLHAMVQPKLPPNVQLAYDGLEIFVNDKIN